MATIHKCPFCLFSFERATAIPEDVNDDITVYKCPNPREDDFGTKFCGKVLPLNFFDAESTVISIAGSRYVGKTNYLIALLMQLKHNKSFQRLGFSGKLVGDKRAIDDILQKIEIIEKKKEALKPTLPEDEAHEKALIVDLSISTGKSTRHVYLSFFDTPGEVYSDIEKMYRNFQCIYKADGLLFLVEPMQIRYLSKPIRESNSYLYSKSQNPHDLQEVFYNVLQLLKYVQKNKKQPKPIQNAKAQEPVAEPVSNEQAPNEQASQDSNVNEPPIVEQPLKASEPDFKETKQTFWQRLFGNNDVPEILHDKIKCPIAIGVTKIDQMRDLMFNDIPFDYTDFESMYLSGDKINMELIADISEELKGIIFNEEQGEISVKNMLEAELKSYEFFGIKSGDIRLKRGDKILKLEQIQNLNLSEEEKNIIYLNLENPQGVLLPLIWLLIKLKLY
ncbi:MAG: hypothetical protein V9F46_12915 [Chitinophagaceae bacterium]